MLILAVTTESIFSIF